MIIGISGLLISILVLVSGASYLWGGGVKGNSDEENKDAGTDLFFICSPVSILTSLAFLGVGVIGLARRKRNRELAEMLKAYRRTRIRDLSIKMGRTEMDVERSILKLLDEKLIEGYMDRNTGEFFTKEFIDQTPDVKFGWKCPSCGARNDTIILPERWENAVRVVRSFQGG